MKIIIHVFLKELKETLRDKRTILTMVVIPILLFPVILSLMVKTTSHFAEEAKSKTLYIAFDKKNENNAFILSLQKETEQDSLLKLIALNDFSESKKLIQEDSLQAAFYLPDNELAAPVVVWHNGTKIDLLPRIKAVLDQQKTLFSNQKLAQHNLSPSDIEGFSYTMMSTASDQETFGKLAGGVLPYIFIVFGFIGCMYPAIDLFTGEKERGTIETLLTAPVERWKILFGKMAVIVLSGLIAAILSLVGLYVSIKGLNLIDDPSLLALINSVLSFKFIGVLFLLQVPLTVFFAGLLIPIAIYAKSFKEAQSIITPLNFVVILPAVIGFLPQIELNVLTAMVPIVNIVLATKELMAGTLNYVYLLISVISMFAFAAAAVFISYKKFEEESSVLM